MKRIGIFLYHNPHMRRNRPCLVGLIETGAGEDQSISTSVLLWMGEGDAPDEMGFLGAGLLEIPENLEYFFAHSVLIGQVSLTEKVLEAIRAGRSADLEIRPLQRRNYHKVLAASLALQAQPESAANDVVVDEAQPREPDQRG